MEMYEKNLQLFLENVDQWRPGLLRLASQFSVTPSDAEDAVQNAYLKALQALPKFQGKSSVKTWVTSIAINEYKTVRRKLNSTQARHTDGFVLTNDEGRDFINEPPSNQPSQLDRMITDERAIAVQEARKLLRLPRAEILRLAYDEELSGKQISNVLGISEPAQKSRLHHARQEIKERMKAGAIRSQGINRESTVLSPKNYASPVIPSHEPSIVDVNNVESTPKIRKIISEKNVNAACVEDPAGNMPQETKPKRGAVVFPRNSFAMPQSSLGL